MRIDTHVLAILSQCTTSDSKPHVLFLPDVPLPRADYLDVNKVIVAMGGKWERRAQGHVFPIDGLTAEGRLERVLLAGEVTVARDEFAFFETTGDALERLMTLADVRPGETVLEPSAGTGRIARACYDAGAAAVCMVEIDRDRWPTLDALAHDFMLGGCQGLPVHGDFLELEIPPPVAQVDKVVMNPPFAVPRNRREDIAHVRHAWEFLKPGGRLVAVMASGVQFREDAQSRSFRGWIDSEGNGRIEEMPAGSFKAAGTSVNTVIVVMDKPS